MKTYRIYQNHYGVISEFPTFEEAHKAMMEVARDYHTNIERVELTGEGSVCHGGLAWTDRVTYISDVFEIYCERETTNVKAYLRDSSIPKMGIALIALMLTVCVLVLCIFTQEGEHTHTELMDAMTLLAFAFVPVFIGVCAILYWDYTDFMRRENQYKRMNK